VVSCTSTGKLHERIYAPYALSDVGESGLISTRTGEIRDSWERELTEHPRASGPSPVNYRRFIDAVTCRRLDQSDEIEFPEQPYLFYSVGSDVLVWDLMRHGGFVNAMARRLVRGGGSIGEAKGRVFERRIMQAISRRLPRAKDVRSRLKVKDPQTRSLVFEADVALVLGQVLVLVEAKSQIKPVPYYLGSFQELGYRADKVCSELRDRDEKLRRHWTLIQARWPRQRISGGLNILVSDQVEFIPSTSRELWLDLGADIPRICTIEEFTAYLGRDTAEADLRDHPHFISAP
jgi:hypothetical protein